MRCWCCVAIGQSLVGFILVCVRFIRRFDGIIICWFLYVKRWPGGFCSSLVCLHRGPVVILHAFFGIIVCVDVGFDGPEDSVQVWFAFMGALW